MKEHLPTPRRTLHKNFTKQTLQRAITTKRRLERKRRFEGVFTMKTLQFLKQPAGALAAIAFVLMSGASVYAAMNWFSGSVKVSADNSIMTVDLSECKSNTPPGVDSADRRNIQFKILGEPHITPESLQEKLLAQCEHDSVVEFYQKQFPNKQFGYQSSAVKAIDGSRITVEATWGGAKTNKVFTMTDTTTFFDQTRPIAKSDVKVGDTVMYLYDLTDAKALDTVNALDAIDVLASVFKTQYDTSNAILVTKLFYTESNIMPLDHYNKLHKN